MIIQISITNKKPKAKENYKIVCGNSDYVINFTFDEEWHNYEKKTARFNFTQDGAKKYIDVLFDGNECPMPILSRTSLVEIGVYAGQLQTTTPCILICEKSILCGNGTHEDPPEDVYIQLLNSMKEPYIGENNNWYVWDIESKSFVDSGVKAKADEETIEQINNTLNQHIETSKIYVTTSSNTDINDVDIDSSEFKGIKEVKFYGYTSQAKGAKLSSPKEIECNTPLDKIHCCEYTQSRFKGYLNKSLYATNNYKDYGWVDLINNKIHYKRFIKRIVLDGSEEKLVWQKASNLQGRYFVNLHLIDGLLTDDDLNRLNDGISIAYADAKCTIGSTYHSNSSFTESGQFRLTQGKSNSNGYFRFEFFAPEFSTLDEVLAQVKKNKITLLIPMKYEVYEDEFDCDISHIIRDYAQNPFTLYFEGMTYSYLGDINIYPTEVTYQLDVGLAIQHMKNAITDLGGKI